MPLLEATPTSSTSSRWRLSLDLGSCSVAAWGLLGLEYSFLELCAWGVELADSGVASKPVGTPRV